MNFRNVKSITIPEDQEVKEVQYNGHTIWKSTYSIDFDVPQGITLVGAKPTEIGNGAVVSFNALFSASYMVRLNNVVGAKMSVASTVAPMHGAVITIREPYADVSFEIVLEDKFDAILENNSWEEISDAVKSGVASSIWSIGDKKSIAVKGTIGANSINTTFYARIVDLNHTFMATRGMVFELCQQGWEFTPGTTTISPVVLSESQYGTEVVGNGHYNMNSTENSNVGGWAQSNIRLNILGSWTSLADKTVKPNTLMSCLPMSLRNVMKVVMTDMMTSTYDSLFVANSKEINNTGEMMGTQLAYYSAGGSKQRYRHPSFISQGVKYWLRTSSSTSTSFRCVSESGALSDATATTSLGISPIFVV